MSSLFTSITLTLDRVTENKIKKILEEVGIIISAGEISNILTQEKRSRKSRMGEHDVYTRYL